MIKLSVFSFREDFECSAGIRNHYLCISIMVGAWFFFFELRTYTVVLQEMCLNSDHYSEVILYPYMTLKQRVMCRDSPSASLVCARISQISVQGPLTVISYLYKLMT